MVTIRVLGTGCAKCIELERMCLNVAEENNINADIQKITDLKEIMSYGIMQTPGLVINGEVKLSGKLPTVTTLLRWMQEDKKESL